MQVKYTRSRRGVAASLLPITLAFALIVGSYQGASGGQTTGVQTTTGTTTASGTGTGTATGQTGTTTGTGTATATATATGTGTTTGQTTGTTTAQTTGTATGQTGTTTGTGTATGQTTGTNGQTATGTGTTGQTTTAQTTGTTTAQTTGTEGTGTATATTTGQTTGTATATATTTGATTTAQTTGGQIGLLTGGTPGSPTAPTATALPLPIFGHSFFAEARQIVEARRRAIDQGATQTNPLTTPVSPEQMIKSNVSVPVPERYQLGPGDSLRITWSSALQAAQTEEVRVDPQGYITVPGTSGARLVVRGQTLAQITDTLTKTIRGYLRNASVTVQLGELRTMAIRILGEVTAPGTYEVPSIMTLFNALYAAGGPTENGTFRAIQLKRSNGQTRLIDLYRLLVRGDSSQDVPLQPGDMILVPPAMKRVAVRGEVRRQALFELVGEERLQEAMNFAGGVRPSGVTQRVLVESIRPGIERRLIEVNVQRRSAADNPPLYDGDVIEVFSIRPIITNAVSISGMVDQPRTFAYTKGMTVADLVEMARGVLPTAYLEKADLFRVNADASKTLISIRLSDALKRMPSANVQLQPNDLLVVYDVNDVQFMGNRRATLKGAVARPGAYYRAQNMTLRDLIIQAGGLLPDAYTQMAMVQRTNADGTPGPLVRVNLSNVLAGTPENLVLNDNDDITIYTIAEAQFLQQQTVEIRGAVQRPGQFTRATNMRLADLIALAGGALPNSYLQSAFLQRTNPDGTPGPLITVDIARVMAGDPTQNVVLEPRDQFTVYTQDEARFIQKQNVEITGAVQRPGSFTKAANMRIADLVTLAGGTLPDAFLQRAFLQRTNVDGTPGPLLTIDIAKALAGDPMHNVLLQTLDRVTVYSQSQAQFIPEQQVEISGAVQRPGAFPRSAGMRVADLLALAGDTLPNANRKRAFLQRLNENGTQGPLLVLDLDKVVAGDPTANLELNTRDKLSVFTQAESQFRVDQVVRIEGALQRPGSFPASSNLNLRALVELAGGVLPNASETFEIHHAWAPVGTPVTRVRVMDVLSGTSEVALAPGDTITLPIRKDLLEKPMVVTVLGEVRFPGPYMITGANDRISDLVKRAGGLTSEAYVNAAEFARNPNFLATTLQRDLRPELVKTLAAVADDEYRRAVALSDMDRLRIVFSQGASINSSPLPIPTLGGGAASGGAAVTPGVTMDQAIAQSLRAEAVTKARELGERQLIPNGNLNVDMVSALQRPGSRSDLTLKDGDVIIIPVRPTTVAVSGAVIKPTSVLFESGRPLDYYVNLAGGLTNDAATDSILIVRANGALVRYKRGVRVEVGDNIIIPTKVMAVRLTQRQSDLEKVTNTVTSAGITVALIRAILGK